MNNPLGHDCSWLIIDFTVRLLCLLSLACVGGAEGYCNHIFCLFVSVSSTNISGQVTTFGLRSSYQQTWNYTRIEIKDRLFLKPFGYKVMTIFTTHDCRFTSGSKRVHGNTTHLVWRLLVLKHSLKSNTIEVRTGCYNIKLALSFCHDSHFSSTYFISCTWSHKTVSTWF